MKVETTLAVYIHFSLLFKCLKNVPAYMNQQTATAVAGRAGAGAVSDNIQNNIISDQTEK